MSEDLAKDRRVRVKNAHVHLHESMCALVSAGKVSQVQSSRSGTIRRPCDLDTVDLRRESPLPFSLVAQIIYCGDVQLASKNCLPLLGDIGDIARAKNKAGAQICTVAQVSNVGHARDSDEGRQRDDLGDRGVGDWGPDVCVQDL